MDDSYRAIALENPAVPPASEPLDLADIRNSLKSLMWRNVGVRRDGDGLREALENINHWHRYVLPRQFSDPTGWELQNMLCAGSLMIEAALVREESRGCHIRNDFPQRDDVHWNRHNTFRREA
jgi:L-aspartate oxidase